MNMQGVLLAAGKGTRLQPLTLVRSKVMAPVAGRPLGARVADLLVAQGIRELVVVVSSDDAEVRPYFADHAGFGVPVRFVEQAERKGMAHALGLAAPLITGDFIMSACDNLVDASHLGEMVATHQHAKAAATLSLMAIDRAQASKTGIVEWDHRFVRRIVEKPSPEEAPSNISSLPLYLFSPELLALLPLIQPSARGEYELQDAIQMLIERTGRVRGVLTATRQQVTTAADLLALNLECLDRDPALCVCSPPLPEDVTLIPPVVIEAGVEIGPGAVLGPRVYVESGARIGAGARLCDSLILRGAEVAARQSVNGAVVAPDPVAARTIS
jgi:NDP-sugar pyrophosphorylase family protein